MSWRETEKIKKRKDKWLLRHTETQTAASRLWEVPLTHRPAVPEQSAWHGGKCSKDKKKKKQREKFACKWILQAQRMHQNSGDTRDKTKTPQRCGAAVTFSKVNSQKSCWLNAGLFHYIIACSWGWGWGGGFSRLLFHWMTDISISTFLPAHISVSPRGRSK